MSQKESTQEDLARCPSLTISSWRNRRVFDGTTYISPQTYLHQTGHLQYIEQTQAVFLFLVCIIEGILLATRPLLAPCITTQTKKTRDGVLASTLSSLLQGHCPLHQPLHQRSSSPLVSPRRLQLALPMPKSRHGRSHISAEVTSSRSHQPRLLVSSSPPHRREATHHHKREALSSSSRARHHHHRDQHGRVARHYHVSLSTLAEINSTPSPPFCDVSSPPSETTTAVASVPLEEAITSLFAASRRGPCSPCRRSHQRPPHLHQQPPPRSLFTATPTSLNRIVEKKQQSKARNSVIRSCSSAHIFRKGQLTLTQQG